MPDEVLDEETDNNPNTTYEDTDAHERTGFRADDSKPLIEDPLPEKIRGEIKISY